MREFSAEPRVILTDGIAEAEVAPAEGGCLSAYRWRDDDRTIDLLRPAPPSGSFVPTDSASFPLVPYSNRIREGRFRFDGREQRLALNFAPARHSIHGHGWKLPWQVVARTENTVILAYDYDGSDWPAPYRAEQRITLRDGVLAIEIAVTNLGDAAMPAGLGLHPYFPRTPQCRLTATVAGMWATDAEVMPTELVAPAPDANPNGGLRPAMAVLDNCFTGFAGRAEIAWPEYGTALAMEADPALAFLVVFTPPAADFFCVEPVSQCTDAVNLAAAGRDDTGLRRLAPGERFAATVRFLPRRIGAS